MKTKAHCDALHRILSSESKEGVKEANRPPVPYRCRVTLHVMSSVFTTHKYFTNRFCHVPNTSYIRFVRSGTLCKPKKNGSVNLVRRRNCTCLFLFQVFLCKRNQNSSVPRDGNRNMHPTRLLRYGVAASKQKGPVIFVVF